MNFSLSELYNENKFSVKVLRYLDPAESTLTFLKNEKSKSSDFPAFFKGESLNLKINLQLEKDKTLVFDKMIISSPYFSKTLELLVHQKETPITRTKHFFATFFTRLFHPNRLSNSQKTQFQTRSPKPVIDLEAFKDKASTAPSNNVWKDFLNLQKKAVSGVKEISFQTRNFFEFVFKKNNHSGLNFTESNYLEIPYQKDKTQISLNTYISSTMLSPFDINVDLMLIYVKQVDGTILGPCPVKFPQEFYDKMVYLSANPYIVTADAKANKEFSFSRSDGEDLAVKETANNTPGIKFDWLANNCVRISFDNTFFKNTAPQKTICFQDKSSGLKTEIPIIVKQQSEE